MASTPKQPWNIDGLLHDEANISPQHGRDDIRVLANYLADALRNEHALRGVAEEKARSELERRHIAERRMGDMGWRLRAIERERDELLSERGMFLSGQQDAVFKMRAAEKYLLDVLAHSWPKGTTGPACVRKARAYFQEGARGDSLVAKLRKANDALLELSAARMTMAEQDTGAPPSSTIALRIAFDGRLIADLRERLGRVRNEERERIEKLYAIPMGYLSNAIADLSTRGPRLGVGKPGESIDETVKHLLDEREREFLDRSKNDPYTEGYRTAAFEIAEGQANYEQANERGVYPHDQNERIMWDQGYDAACVSHRLGFDPLANLPLFGPSVCPTHTKAALVAELLDGKSITRRVRPDPRDRQYMGENVFDWCWFPMGGLLRADAPNEMPKSAPQKPRICLICGGSKVVASDEPYMMMAAVPCGACDGTGKEAGRG